MSKKKAEMEKELESTGKIVVVGRNDRPRHEIIVKAMDYADLSGAERERGVTWPKIEIECPQDHYIDSSIIVFDIECAEDVALAIKVVRDYLCRSAEVGGNNGLE